MSVPLPQLSELPEEGRWVRLETRVSEPTEPDGDWTSLQHLACSEAWKEAMRQRVEKLETWLFAKKVVADACTVCKPHGVGHLAGYSAHVCSKNHFKYLGWHLPNGGKVHEAGANLWQEWKVPGGGIRFNHVDGCIDMYRGELAAAGAALVLPAPALKLAATPGLRTHAEMDVLAGEIDFEPFGVPGEQFGDWTTCSWLTRGLWKECMTERAPELCSLLVRCNVKYPHCGLCGSAFSGSLEGHLPGPKHWAKLYERLQSSQGVPLSRVADAEWQTWHVEGGCIRFNHVHGGIVICRKQLPLSPPPPPVVPPPGLAIAGGIGCNSDAMDMDPDDGRRRGQRNDDDEWIWIRTSGASEWGAPPPPPPALAPGAESSASAPPPPPPGPRRASLPPSTPPFANDALPRADWQRKECVGGGHIFYNCVTGERRRELPDDIPYDEWF